MHMEFQYLMKYFCVCFIRYLAVSQIIATQYKETVRYKRSDDIEDCHSFHNNHFPNS